MSSRQRLWPRSLEFLIFVVSAAPVKVLASSRQAAAAASALGTPRTAPRVYVYDLPQFWDYSAMAMSDMRAKKSGKVQELVFGPRCKDDEYRTNMFAATSIVLWRILRSSTYYVSDPRKADLFMIPMWPREKSKDEWDDVCRRKSNLKVASMLPYLTKDNAHRHMIVVAKGHIVPMLHCDAWWKVPKGLLSSAMRFAYSNEYRPQFHRITKRHGYGPPVFDDDASIERLVPDVMDDRAAYPHLVSIPYPSSIHSSIRRGIGSYDELHAQARVHPRKNLATFVGLAHPVFNNTGGKYARSRNMLIRDCGRQHDCDLVEPDTECGENLKHYVDATFCFQPGGDSPYRKGLYDAVVVGCIPVVFGLYNTRIAQWHFWGSRGTRAYTVVVNETKYLRGEIDLFGYLRSIPRTKIHKMQSELAQNAHRVQYALVDESDDAVDILLKGAWHLARSRDISVAALSSSSVPRGKDRKSGGGGSSTSSSSSRPRSRKKDFVRERRRLLLSSK